MSVILLYTTDKSTHFEAMDYRYYSTESSEQKQKCAAVISWVGREKICVMCANSISRLPTCLITSSLFNPCLSQYL